MVLGVCAKCLLFTSWYTHKLCNSFCLPTVQCSMVLRVCVQSVNMSTFCGQTRERSRGTDVWILQRSKFHFFSSYILERSGLWCDMWSILLWTLCVVFQIMFFAGTKLFSFTKLRKKGKRGAVKNGWIFCIILASHILHILPTSALYSAPTQLKLGFYDQDWPSYDHKQNQSLII